MMCRIEQPSPTCPALINVAFLYENFELKSNDLRFAVPVAISFRNEFIIFAH